MAVQTHGTLRRVSVVSWARSHWVYIAITGVVLFNLAMLVAYQHYLAADFPFQDEIGYVNRLQHLPETGLFHYVFDPYWHYYIPTQLYIWYQFYALTHLNIMTVRYTGATISALASLLLCVMLYRKAFTLNVQTLLAILCCPFIICSYNHWASYDQSIESVVEPLLFGLTLALIWIAEKIQRAFGERAPIGQRVGWIGLFTAIWILASGIGPPPLVVLAAIVGARFLLERRFSPSLILLAIIAVAAPCFYLIAGEGISQKFSASQSAFGLKELFDALKAAIGLIGNSLYTPVVARHEPVTLGLGVAVLVAQIAIATYALRLPVEQRSRFMIPLTLTLYSWLVLLEIIGARLHELGVAFIPRYSWFGLYAPVSLFFWFVTLASSVRRERALSACVLVLVLFGTASADEQTARQLPFARTALAKDRETLMSLQGRPTPEQQAVMFVNPPLADYVYPDLEFLRREHLAMYEGAGATLTTVDEPLAVLAFGPSTIRAGASFNVQANGSSSLWLRTNWQTEGQVFIVIGGTKLHGFHRDDIVTTFVPAFLYSKPGSYPMYVVEAANGKTTRSNTVSFVVH